MGTRTTTIVSAWLAAQALGCTAEEGTDFVDGTTWDGEGTAEGSYPSRTTAEEPTAHTGDTGQISTTTTGTSTGT
jgi:hypothetical protein